jgi:hypothetical protein
MNLKRVMLGYVFALTGLAACSAPPSVSGDGNLGEESSDLYLQTGAPLWSGVVPVCWMPTDAGGPADNWFAEKATIRRSLIEAWQSTANVQFSGWRDCPTSGTERFVKIHVGNHQFPGQPSDHSGDGQTDASLGTNLLRGPSDPCSADNSGSTGGTHCSSVRFWLQPDHSTSATRIRYLAVHEFGHVLGFNHEQDRPDNPFKSSSCPGGTGSGTYVGAYDGTSVMNYCGPNDGTLSAGDRAGVQSLYGVPAYAAKNGNDRYFHDASGNVFHQSSNGAVAQILAASGGFGAASSIASYAYPVSGQTVWFLDTLQPSHLRQIFTPSSGVQRATDDMGTAPAGCTWSGSPAVSSWGEGRGDFFVNASCAGRTHLFHKAWEAPTMGAWTDISPPGVTIGSSPAVVSREIGVLDVVLMNSSHAIVHGICEGNCTGADAASFTWEAPASLQGASAWAGQPALVSPAPGFLRAFGVDLFGNIASSAWSASTSKWDASSTWYAPSSKCDHTAAGGPAAARSGQNSVFVACTSESHDAYGGWGNTALSTTWWQLAGGVYGGPGLSTH